MAAAALKVLAVVIAFVQQVAAQPSFNSAVVVAPSPPTVGVAITSLAFDIVSTNAIAFTGAGSLVITAEGDPLFTGGAATTVPASIGLNGADPGSCVVTMTDQQTLTITGCAADLNIGELFTMTLTSDLVNPATASAQTFALNDGTASATALAGWTTSASGGLSDPITTFNGTRTKFWIPAGTYTTLLNTPEVSLLAMPLMGPKDLQWFDRLKVVLPGGDVLAEVAAVRKPSQVVNGYHFGEQINVMPGDGVHVAKAIEASLFSTKDGKVKAAAYKQPYHIARTHGKNEIEHFHVETPSIAFNIYASHAGNEFPDAIDMQKEYIHLDFQITSSTKPMTSYSGVLPELWGTIPRSPEVQAMTVSPLASAVCTE